MYSCTKNFNIKTTYGIQRIIAISVLLSIVTFLLSFELFSAFVNERFDDAYFPVFLVALVLVYPVHKLLHVAAFMPNLKSLVVQKTYTKFWLPIINIRVNHPIKRYHFALALITPFVVITIITLTGAFLMPSFAHYFLFIFSANAGMSFLDFIYLKYIMKAPKESYIEERKHGLELLTRCVD